MTDTQWLDTHEQEAWRSLMKMQAGLSDFLDRRLRTECGVSTADYQVLVHLSEAPDGRLRSFELGALLRWEKSRLSQHVSRMQMRDLVLREPCPTDQRGCIIAITSPGRELIESAAPVHVSDVRDVFVDALTPAELTTLSAIGAKVTQRLEARRG